MVRSLSGYIIVHNARTTPDQARIDGTGSLANVLALATGKAPAKQSTRTATLVAEEGLEPPTRGL